MSTLPVNTTNTYQFYDYDKPIVLTKNDMRTSYNFGHRNYLINDQIQPPSILLKNPCETLRNKEIRYDYTTEAKNQFTWKMPITTNEQRADRYMSCKKPQFIQKLQEHTFKKPPPLEISNYISYRQDYQPKIIKQGDSLIKKNFLYKSPSKSLDVIRPNQDGFYKYLDPYATETMLSYPMRTINQQNGISRKDNLTVWDWLEMPKTEWGFGLKSYPIKKSTVKQSIYDTKQFKSVTTDRVLMKPHQIVPNNGYRSEKQAEYDIKLEKEFRPNLVNIKPSISIKDKIEPSENTMYGSGKLINSIIKQNK